MSTRMATRMELRPKRLAIEVCQISDEPQKWRAKVKGRGLFDTANTRAAALRELFRSLLADGYSLEWLKEPGNVRIVEVTTTRESALVEEWLRGAAVVGAAS